MELVAEVCVDAAHADVAHVGHWLEHRNDVAALEALISRGYVVDTMEVVGRWRDLPAIYDPTVAALRSVQGPIAASAHQPHRHPDSRRPDLTFPPHATPAPRNTPYPHT